MATVYDIDPGGRVPALETAGLTVSVGPRVILEDFTLTVPDRSLVALVGPSGCGKTMLLRSFNRMHDLVPGVTLSGDVRMHGRSVFDPGVDPAEIRRRAGMVFQRPTPFPSSVFENVAFGPRLHGFEGDPGSLVEESLRRAGLWDEVGDRLFEPASGLSAGQQQRLCIARTLAVNPEILLMDEPASELDPRATRKIEELIQELKADYTIVLVTHHLQQAARVSDYTAFIQDGALVEYGPTRTVFTNPREARTEAFITGRSP